MRPHSSTLLFSVGLLLSTAHGPAYALRPQRCLPPVFEGGQRLHNIGTANEVSPLWLQLLMRQHEICWRVPGQQSELRIALAGNSAVYGYPWPVEDTVGSLLNQHFAAHQVPAHVFNLGFVMTYQLKDALIIHKSLQYEPDLIVYAVTLADFLHALPTGTLEHFFAVNGRALAAFSEERPPGLTEPADTILSVLNRRWTRIIRSFPINEVGGLVRAVIRSHARSVRQWFSPEDAAPTQPTRRQRTPYSCAHTKEELATQYSDWQGWNILAYLQQIRERTGVEVMIVNWPVAHDPVDDCYSVRFSAAAVEQYNTWIREQAQARGFRYLDLHDRLPLDDFVDSLHISRAGHRMVAEQLAPVLDSLIASMLQKRASPQVVSGARSRAHAESGPPPFP